MLVLEESLCFMRLLTTGQDESSWAKPKINEGKKDAAQESLHVTWPWP